MTAAKHVQKCDAIAANAAISSFDLPARYVSSLMLQALWGAYGHPSRGLYDLAHPVLASLKDSKMHLSGRFFLSTDFLEFWLLNVEAALPSFMIDQMIQAGDRPWSAWYSWLIPQSVVRQTEPSQIERLKELVESLPWQQYRVQAVSLAHLAMRSWKHDRASEAEALLNDALELACPEDSQDYESDGVEEAEALSEVAKVVVEGVGSASSAMVEKLYGRLCEHCGEWAPKAGRMVGGYGALRAAATRACVDEDPGWAQHARSLYNRVEFGQPDALNHLQVWAALRCTSAGRSEGIAAPSRIDVECALWLLSTSFEAKMWLVGQLMDSGTLPEASQAWLHWIEHRCSKGPLAPRALESLDPRRLEENLLLRLYGHLDRASGAISSRDRETLVKRLFELGVSDAAWRACDEIEEIRSRRRAAVCYAPKTMPEERWTQLLELGLVEPPPSDFELELFAQKISGQTPGWAQKALIAQAEAHPEATARCRTLSALAAAQGRRYALDRVPELVAKLLTHLEQVEPHLLVDSSQEGEI